MRLFVVGANGGLGRLVVKHALAGGHEVTAFVRDGNALPRHAALTVVLGSVVDEPERVRDAVRGHDAVLSGLGNPLWLAGKRGPAITARATGNLIAAMRSHGVRRVALPLAWGSGASRPHASPLVRAAAATLIRRDYADFDAAEARLERSGLDWTVAYFGRLTDAPAGPGPHASAALRTPANLAVSRADLARFLVDCVVENRFVRQRAVVSGPPARTRSAWPVAAGDRA